jgi:hypothetical protein
MNEQSFEQTYAQMMDGVLAKVLRGKRYLVPAARKALDLEIQRRNLDPEQPRKQRPRSLEKRRHPLTVEKRLKGKWLRWPWMVALIILSFSFALLLDHFGVEQLFWPIIITIVVPIFTLWGFWELRGRLWFWAVIVTVVATNAVLFSLIGWPWGTHWIPARSIEGFCTLESIPIFALIARLQKRMHRGQHAGLEPPDPGAPSS